MIDQVKLSCAIHMANAVIRTANTGNAEEADRIQNRMADIVEAEPDIFLLALARKLGRARARAVNIEDEVIEYAVRSPDVAALVHG